MYIGFIGAISAKISVKYLFTEGLIRVHMESEPTEAPKKCDKDYKFTALLPCDLAMEFTSEARRRAVDDDQKVKGAIGRAVQEAIKLWLGKE